MPPLPFSKVALLKEFRRLKWSGVPEEALEHTPTRLALIASVKTRLRAEATKRSAARRRTRPADDFKRRQANDLD
ncbi:hypothetical protein AB4Z48_17790 [Cupriavidus sp. 2TAF22]|uniref:hypothetical protein n=1 Tax=unclassified Cupriavidus TaxID=2640874 RepID=UPI003F8F4042